ncbi:hypothetical protein I6F26_04930 [Ensifer sp. IC3342]|nr:hypothetical protein [Ensifer sp. BRP08]MCA1445934.1 hypothetical protein [Ensifer sp. IC3342]
MSLLDVLADRKSLRNAAVVILTRSEGSSPLRNGILLTNELVDDVFDGDRDPAAEAVIGTLAGDRRARSRRQILKGDIRGTTSVRARWDRRPARRRPCNDKSKQRQIETEFRRSS